MREEKRVFISSRSFGKLCEEAVEMLKQVAEVDRTTFERALTEDELIQILPKYDAIIVGVDPITRKVLNSSTRLKVVAKHGAGVDNIDLKAATDNGVIVTYVPGVNADSVADFTFCLILALTRNLIPAHISTKSGRWEPRRFVGMEIYRKTLGIIGMGTIGSKVARRAKGFDMRVICTTAHPEKHKEEAEKHGIEFVDLETLMKESDIVSIHCALTPETEGMIGEKELRLMKKTAFLINTARGPIVDEKAVYKALKEGWISGAAFDVYTREPPGPECPLFELDNVIVAPHIGQYTKEALSNLDLIQARDIIKALSGKKPEFVANPDVLKKLFG